MLLVHDLLAQLLLEALVLLDLGERRLETSDLGANGRPKIVQLANNLTGGFADLGVATNAGSEVYLWKANCSSYTFVL